MVRATLGVGRWLGTEGRQRDKGNKGRDDDDDEKMCGVVGQVLQASAVGTGRIQTEYRATFNPCVFDFF
jgi:hypothetical protein